VTALAPTRPIGLFWQYTLNAGAVNEAIGLARDLGCALLAPGELPSEFTGGSPRGRRWIRSQLTSCLTGVYSRRRERSRGLTRQWTQPNKPLSLSSHEDSRGLWRGVSV